MCKCPGVHPVSIGDTAKCIVAKAVLAVIREDIQDAVGAVQLCAGQIAGCEAAVHAVRKISNMKTLRPLCWSMQVMPLIL